MIDAGQQRERLTGAILDFAAVGKGSRDLVILRLVALVGADGLAQANDDNINYNVDPVLTLCKVATLADLYAAHRALNIKE